MAIILIATTIMTYSTIRYSPVETQPQVLSAIDETNLAIKQVLGFTVGYYGSVLQVTGNTSYAHQLAVNYLYGGLEHVGNMHPDWGTSFNITNIDMRTYWYSKTSYSRGEISVNYSLTGLGMYGITYDTSAKLNVTVLDSPSKNQTSVSVTVDENEPLVNLGRTNFKLYRYSYGNSTWEQSNPVLEPFAFGNGTYILDCPAGVDPSAYLVQVEDTRGIIVVASSFSSITCSMFWTPTGTPRYAVSGNSPQILGPPDLDYATVPKGTIYEVNHYARGTFPISKVHFNISYYGTVSGTLQWGCRLDAGPWVTIGSLPQGGSATSPLTASFDATTRRTSWTWDNLDATSINFSNTGGTGAENAYIDAIYVTVVPQQIGSYAALSNSTISVELLQNGTTRWLGQNLELTTASKPIPPLPVKSIHINQTMNGANTEVPFQIEDWESQYQVPLGMTNNASVFNNKNMLVFLITANTSKITIWWDGNDYAEQTPYAYVNRYFTGDNPSASTLTNGKLRLQFGSEFTVTAILGSTQVSTATFPRINNQMGTYGSGLSYIITSGVVRDIVHQEAEWGGGATNCPNVYCHVVLTLPANSTFYTYKVRMMFVESQQTRNIADLSIIQLSTSIHSGQTENGVSGGYPLVSTTSGTYSNSSAPYTAHHWAQLISAGSGSGIMFTDMTNLQLYAFDSIAGGPTGGLKTDLASGKIEVLPVTLAPVQFTYSLDRTWEGAVAAFDSTTTPIYTTQGGNPTGLWVMVENPPMIEMKAAS